ncbi:MAG: septum formation initiator family protein [Defluviitaleaceae bacterium]|nr:septum formation initiator family protein [Defluviitaleaceae bacterium]
MSVYTVIHNVIKDGISFAKKSGNSEIIDKLIDVQQKILDIQHENQTLRKENEELKKFIETDRDMIDFEGHLYNKANPNNFGPFCQHCWAAKRKEIKIVPDMGNMMMHTPKKKRYICPSCKTHYTEPNADELREMLYT